LNFFHFLLFILNLKIYYKFFSKFYNLKIKMKSTLSSVSNAYLNINFQEVMKKRSNNNSNNYNNFEHTVILHYTSTTSNSKNNNNSIRSEINKEILLTRRKTTRSQIENKNSKDIVKTQNMTRNPSRTSSSYSTTFTEEQLILINNINKPSKRKSEKIVENTSSDSNKIIEVFDPKKEQLKKEVELYKPFYKKELNEYISISVKHKFMVRNFPESYTLENFYLNIVKKRTLDTSASTVTRLPKKERTVSYLNKLKNFKNNTGINKFELTGFKKIWTPGVLNCHQINLYLVVVKKFWLHEQIGWTHEGALEYLSVNHFNVTKTIKLIKNQDKAFINFIKKYTKNKGNMIQIQNSLK
jgi:hypothetical protein